MKLYYDDPLIAVYMVREFGVKFKAEHMWCLHDVTSLYGEIEISFEDKTEFDFGLCLFSNTEIGHTSESILYIHSDSHSIFEPQDGDLIYMKNGSHTMLIDDIWIENFGDKFDLQLDEIIQRNGKHFFMPNIEG